MKQKVLVALVGISAALSAPARVAAYDIDCAIILCMAGGFPASAVCSDAYRTMIRRITPHPVRPPFGICSFASAPSGASASIGEEALDVSGTDYDWLRRTRVHWFWGTAFENRNGDRRWSWQIRSCDHENAHCIMTLSTIGAVVPWPSEFIGGNGQSIPTPDRAGSSSPSVSAVMIEFSDVAGNIGYSRWSNY